MPNSVTPKTNRTPRSVGRAFIGLGVIAIWLAVAAVGGPKVGGLSSVQTNNQATALPSSAESVKTTAAQAQFSEDRSLPAFVVFNAAAPTADQLAGWQAFVGSLPQLPVRGTTLSAFTQAPIVPVVSKDGTSLLAVVALSTTVTTIDTNGDRPLTDIVAQLRSGASAVAGPGATSHVAGPAGLTADLSAAFGGIDSILLLVTLIVVLSILVLVYRAVVLPFIVLFNSVCALALAGGIVYWLADSDVIVLNGQSQGILLILVLGAATDYGLLLVARYREELTRHEKPRPAMIAAWRGCIEPIAASAGTVIIGLLCLLFSNLATNRSLGPVGAIGIASAALAATTLLPALLLGGRWLFWPRVPKHPAVAESPGRHAAGQSTAGDHRFWAGIADWVGRRPRQIWIATSVLLVLACLAVPTLKASGTSVQETFLNPTDSVTGQEVLAQHFSGLVGDPVVIITTESTGAAVKVAVEGLASVDSVSFKADRQTGRPMVVNTLLEVQVTLSSTADAKQAVRDIRNLAHAAAPESLVGGTVARQVDTTEIAARDLGVIIPIVLVVVFLVLALLLRSLVAPLLLVFATVLSFGAALGVSALMFNHVFNFPGSDPAVPLFGFVFLVALGVDYSIFLMSRAREEVLRAGPREGVLTALRVTGGVITSAGVVLAATFAALSVIPILFLAQIAFIVAFGVLLDTLLVRTLLVPALALDLDRRTWWPSGISRRVGIPGRPQ